MPSFVTDEQRLRSGVDTLVHALTPHYPGALAGLNTLAATWRNDLLPNSIRAMAVDLRKWAEWGKRLELTEPLLSAAAIRRITAEMRSSGLRPRTISRLAFTLAQVRKALGTTDTDADDVLRQIRVADARAASGLCSQRHEADPMRMAQLRRIAAVANPHCPSDTAVVAIAFVLYDSQLPLSRLLGDRCDGRWRLPFARSHWLQRTRAGADLLVPASAGMPKESCFLSAQTLSWVDRYLALRGHDEPLFSNSRGSPFEATQWLNRLRRLAYASGVRGPPPPIPLRLHHLCGAGSRRDDSQLAVALSQGKTNRSGSILRGASGGLTQTLGFS